jgi:hypothetical protein
MNLKVVVDGNEAEELLVKTRRRGAELEGALLDAVWA